MVLKRINFPADTLMKLDKKRRQKKLTSEAETIRMYVDLGLFVDSLKEETQNPEFVEKIKTFVKNEKIFEWTETFTPDELNVIKDAVMLTIEKKYKQEKLLRAN